MKKFETFITDNNRDKSSIDFLPKYNPVVQQNAKKYVDEIIQNGDLNLLYKAVGVEPPKDVNSMNMDDIYDEIKQKAIDYYIENPESMGKDIPMKKFKVNAGDGIPRTNNVGGALHSNSPRIGESNKFNQEIEISSDEMEYFNEEEPLIKLIRNGKIILNNNQIKYDPKDKETLSILDIYFEVDGVDPIEESLSFLEYSDSKESSILNIGLLGHQFNVSLVDDLDKIINIIKNFDDIFLFTLFDESLINKLVKIVEISYPGSKVKYLLNVYDMPLESSDVLNLNIGRYQVLTFEISNEEHKIILNLIKSVSDYIIVSIGEIQKSVKDTKGIQQSWEKITINGFEENQTYICNLKYEFDGWKELLSKIFESIK